LIEALEARLATAPAAEWDRRLREEGVPAGLVGTVADGVTLAQQCGLEPTVDVGSSTQIRHPVRYEAAAVAAPAPPPALGADTDRVLRWLRDTERGVPLERPGR
jgi:formyl-CoA transferase